VNAPTPAQRLALPSNVAWILWGALQGGVVLLLGITVLLLKLLVGHPLLPASNSWFADVFAGIAALPVLAGVFVHWTWVRGEPGENQRIVRRIRKLLVESNASSDPRVTRSRSRSPRERLPRRVDPVVGDGRGRSAALRHLLHALRLPAGTRRGLRAGSCRC
jgi:hypothetical protein